VSINGQLIASPELVFLQLAPKLNIHQLILLGLQMCSHPVGRPGQALTTKNRLSLFLSKTSWHRGHRKALRALKYIMDGSASIAESQAYMVLTLPHALGGYGLKGATFNHEIKLKDQARKRLKQNRCFVDIFYKPEKVAVEYDSFAYHNTPEEQGKDAQRSQILSRHGLKVMHMYTIQLYNIESCKDFAFNLAAELKRRIQNRAKKFSKMHTQLRSLLNTKGTSLYPVTQSS
jgi:very-short-patch-repair endonuclease